MTPYNGYLLIQWDFEGQKSELVLTYHGVPNLSFVSQSMVQFRIVCFLVNNRAISESVAPAREDVNGREGLACRAGPV